MRPKNAPQPYLPRTQTFGSKWKDEQKALKTDIQIKVTRQRKLTPRGTQRTEKPLLGRKLAAERIARAVHKWFTRRILMEDCTLLSGVTTWVRWRLQCCKLASQSIMSGEEQSDLSPLKKIFEHDPVVSAVVDEVTDVGKKLLFWLSPSIQAKHYTVARQTHKHQESIARGVLLEEEAFTRVLLVLHFIVLPARSRAAVALRVIPQLNIREVRRALLIILQSGTSQIAAVSTWIRIVGYASDLSNAHEVFMLTRDSIKSWSSNLGTGIQSCESHSRTLLLSAYAKSRFKYIDVPQALLSFKLREHSQRRSIRYLQKESFQFFIQLQSRRPNYSRLEIIKFLGKGSQGELNLVKDKKTERYHARKDVVCSTVDQLKERFDKAMFHSRSVRHKNIVRYLSVEASWSSKGKPKLRIAMPFYECGHLGNYIKKSSKIAVKERLKLGYQILSAIRYLHSQTPPVIHRDVKPENILLTNHSTKAVLVDFDISRLLLESCISSQGGTFQYAAPETLIWFRTTPASDLFSVGVILFQMCCLPTFPTLPLPGRSQTATAEGSLLLNSEKWTPETLEASIRQAMVSLPEALVTLVVKLCSHDSEIRGTAAGASSVLKSLLID